MTRRRVVITGLGAVTPLANTVSETWEGILAGKSGISHVDKFDASGLTTQFAGMIKNFNAEDFGIPKKEQRRMDDFIVYGMAATQQALDDAQLGVTEEERDRVGVVMGSGIGGVNSIEQNQTNFVNYGLKKVSPFLIPSSVINMLAGNVSIRHGFRGPNFAITTACTTGTHNIGQAARLIQYNEADVVIAGSSELASCPLGLAGFCAARALSTRNDDPQSASRPWDRDRDGFVLSDGAGIVVLEEYERAKKRGAKIYCEIIGFGMSADAHHITAPPEDGRGAAMSMSNALKDAAINADEVNYINAHGTSTLQGDIAEIRSVKKVFGDHAYKLSMSSTKSMIGHLLGAAGSVEAVLSALAIRDQVAPPTINLENPDDECDLDLVANEAKPRPINVSISNSFGFGGTNASLVFRKVD